MNNPTIDFSIVNTKKRKQLFFKRPKGTLIPDGMIWRCICGTDNKCSGPIDQYCQSCGSRLRFQENAEDKSRYCTLVLVVHFNM